MESNVFAPQTINLQRMIALIGMHGTGKSLFLRMIDAAFGYSELIYCPPFLKGYQGTYFKSAVPGAEGTVEISLKTPSGTVSHVVELGQPAEKRADIWKADIGESFHVWYADPIGAFNEFSYMYDNYDFTKARPKSEIKWEVTRADLDALRNILGRRYDRVTITSGRVDSELEMPSIFAHLGSKTFDNTAMSQGELWVHYINWFLRNEGDTGDLALLDEPEAFLAVQGRRPFIDQIAKIALRNDRQFVIGTHSPEMLARFPLTHVRMCVPSDSGIQIVTPKSLVEIHDCVGIDTPIRALALVEDNLAKLLLSAIFARFDIALGREVEIIAVGGTAEALHGQRIMGKAQRISCVAVLDGDQLTDPAAPSEADCVFYLPGPECPEDQLAASALHSIDLASKMTGIDADQIAIAINSCLHLDHQYILGRIAERLGYSEDFLTQIFIQLWLRRPEISREAEKLAVNVRNILLNV
jgi:hypothetical protein